MNQQPSLTSYVASGSNPKTDCLFFPFGGRVASVKYHHGTTADTTERIGAGTVYRAPRSQMLNVSHLDAALKAYSSRMSFQVFARKQQQQLEQVWKSPVTRSAIM
ncbi:hypothetical protein GNI_089000 [Gregarina niphandrodes]|uniref:Uncharacterized protein n=1 Tax=Gregarina niphandrodes TaxID=110365 RepID=A0A023B5W5_GRENI|nr:hypothetical protein GNI_089000 [Gregarina niphandrodes]EZG61400.1 hypothetical protein GNI_089000 [Gregarina niphandrodes]|eukprot:XP_011130760.1 hypothetical protein GNI_089000 [Gregarina niphandrodes]